MFEVVVRFTSGETVRHVNRLEVIPDSPVNVNGFSNRLLFPTFSTVSRSAQSADSHVRAS